MSITEAHSSQDAKKAVEHFDVLIAGAGISGIGSAYHLQEQCPDKSFVILEVQESFGGTWLTHKYPGIRSDSDLYTFGYRFKPWVGPPIATADEIRTYMDEVIKDNDLDQHIRYKHKITGAHWSNADKMWTIDATRVDTGEKLQFTANFLWMCQGYYNHDQGYTPEWEGMEDFRGQIVHPQTWPEDLDYKDKNVLVIGSGATAATIIPAMAADCAHITMLQRSPTYFRPGRNENEIANMLRQLEIDETWIHEISRRAILFEQQEFTKRCFEEPEVVKQELLDGVKEYLGEEYDIGTHFTPKYLPWRQRLAFVPDGDIFQGIAQGKATVVTDEIDRFTDKGILLKSGDLLEADIIVTATGFNLSVLGDIPFDIDGEPINWSDKLTYRGMMFSGVPNLVWVFGYFRASWTLRVDLLGDFVCRLLKHMDRMNVSSVRPELRPEDEDMEILPWLDDQNFNPGYMMRSMHLMPKSGNKPEWQHNQDYWAEKKEIPKIDLEGTEFVYE